MSILKIKDLVHKYVTYGDTEEDKQEIAAINHIDINVEKGEFVAILGKNGSGKSSLAKHINGNANNNAPTNDWIRPLP